MYQRDLVYDVGAHLGEDSDFYLRLGYRVVAIEANPELASHLRRRFSEAIATGRYLLVEAAVASFAGEHIFYKNDAISVWGTTQPDWAARNERLGTRSTIITVQGARFGDILKLYGCPHYLKIDIEGADMLCVEALDQHAERPVYLSLESTKTSWAQLLREFDRLESLGYRRFQVINQRKHRAGDFVGVDGSLIPYEFGPGASGPFGDYLQGRWLTRAEALDVYRRVFRFYRLLGDDAPLAKVLRKSRLTRNLPGYLGWYDTHARRPAP